MIDFKKLAVYTCSSQNTVTATYGMQAACGTSKFCLQLVRVFEHINLCSPIIKDNFFSNLVNAACIVTPFKL
jgi:hypothetical protein